MKIQQYNPVNGALLSDVVTGVSFGDVLRANHCESTVLVRPAVTTESAMTDMKVYLQSAGSLTATHIGRYAFSGLVTGIKPDDAELSTHFTGATSSDFCAIPNGGYLWLDMQAGDNEVGVGSANLRFTFDYT